MVQPSQQPEVTPQGAPQRKPNKMHTGVGKITKKKKKKKSLEGKGHKPEDMHTC